MARINLDNVSSGFNLSKINSNFQKIQDIINSGLLGRTLPNEPNMMNVNLDMNSNRIYNLPAPISPNEPVRKQDVLDMSGSIAEVEALVEQAEQAVVDASNASRLTIGTVSSGPANATITGVAGAQLLNLVLQTGNTGAPGTNGRGIVSVVRTSGTGAAGTTDTYTITYTDATTSTFQVYNGANGAGSGDVIGPAGGVIDGEIPLFNSTTGKLIKGSSGQTLSALLTTISDKQATLVSGTNIKTVNGTTLLGSGNLAVGDVVGPASSVNNQIAVFNGTTGKLLADGGKALPTGAVIGSTDAQTLTNKTVDLSANTVTVDGTNPVGFRNIPQNSQSAAYTLVLADAGKHILHPSADTTARTYTIPANSSVAYPIGTAISFVNQNAAGVVTIAITTDTMRLAGAGTTGSRTLAANGMATALKITSTEWIISGNGLT